MIPEMMKLRTRIETDDPQCTVEDVSKDGCLVRDTRNGYTFRVRKLADWLDRVRQAKLDETIA